jgi:hypothetical protein
MLSLRIRHLVAAFLAGAASCVWSGEARATPLLQLEVSDGVYIGGTDETTVATTNTFTLYAFLTPQSGTTTAQLNALLDRDHYIAASLAPRAGTTTTTFGSFSFNSTTVNATADMVYGTPPAEGYLGGNATYDSGDLSKHGVYDTYFKQFSFKFRNAGVVNRANVYNVEDDTQYDGPTNNPTGSMYYMAFQVDTSALTWRTAVHFDLYSTKTLSGGDIDIDKFAPFSHDARSMPGAIPEPGSIVLLGSGAALLAAWRLRRRTRSSSTSI